MDRGATGTWADDANTKRVTFAPVNVRYVRLTGFTEAGNRGSWTSVAELNLLGPDPALGAVTTASRTGWTATASDAQGGNGAANVLDGSLLHPVAQPVEPVVGAAPLDPDRPGIGPDDRRVYYLPRDPATGGNGRIGQYRIETSTNATTWATVATGRWADYAATKRLTFTPVSGRSRAKSTGLTEACGNRGPWMSAAEINLLVPASAPPVTVVPGRGSSTRWPAPVGRPPPRRSTTIAIQALLQVRCPAPSPPDR